MRTKIILGVILIAIGLYYIIGSQTLLLGSGIHVSEWLIGLLLIGYGISRAVDRHYLGLLAVLAILFGLLLIFQPYINIGFENGWKFSVEGSKVMMPLIIILCGFEAIW